MNKPIFVTLPTELDNRRFNVSLIEDYGAFRTSYQGTGIAKATLQTTTQSYKILITADEITAKIEEAEIQYEAERDYRQNKVAFIMGNLDEKSRESLQIEVEQLQSRIDTMVKGLCRLETKYSPSRFADELREVIDLLKGSEGNS